METHPILRRYPDLRELFLLFRNEMLNNKRPADQVILTDQDVMKLLKISKRKLDYLKARKKIPYHQPEPHSSCYYLLSDILEWLKKSRVDSIDNNRRF